MRSQRTVSTECVSCSIMKLRSCKTWTVCAEHQPPGVHTSYERCILSHVLVLDLVRTTIWGFPHGSDGKESVCNAGDLGLIPGSGRSPGKGNGYPLQYSCLENVVDRGTWWATVRGVTKSWTQLSDLTILTFHRPLSFWFLYYKWVDI